MSKCWAPWGALLLQRAGADGFTTEELSLAGDFARLTVLHIDQAVAAINLRRSAELAALTGSFNRRTIDQWLARAFTEAARDQQPVSALFLDLDVVIVDDITPFFEVPGEFLIIHDWKRPWRITGNSSVYRWRLGAHADLLTYFREHVNEVRARVRHEQAYLSDHLHKQGKLAYWPAAWCASWKYHCIPRFPTNYWREPFIPEGARILVFHGVMNPPDALAGKSQGNWRRAKPAPWIAGHWRE